MGHAGISDAQRRAEEKRAFWFVKSTSGKTIWPMKKYIIVKTYFDAMGRPPIYGLSWDRIYTKNEYMMYLLTNK